MWFEPGRSDWISSEKCFAKPQNWDATLLKGGIALLRQEPFLDDGFITTHGFNIARQQLFPEVGNPYRGDRHG